MSIIINGQNVDNQTIESAYLNRSFKYGDGLFETIRRMQGTYPLLHLHRDRLGRGLSKLGMRWPPTLSSPEKLTDQLDRLLPEQPNLRLRLTVFREAGGAYAPAHDRTGFFLEGVPLGEDHYPSNQEGLMAGYVQSIQLHPTDFSALKTTSALPYVLAGKEIQEQGWEEGIILNHQHHLCEAGSSNIFVRMLGNWMTPPLAEGCIDGVMRRYLLEVLFPSLGLTCKEVPITKADIKEGDVIWITNSIRGIRWIGKLGSKALQPGPLTEAVDALNQALLPTS